MSNEVNNNTRIPLHQSTVTHYVHPSTTTSALFATASVPMNPQHMPPNMSMPISLQPYVYPSSLPIDPNDIFSNLKLRKGKWTPVCNNFDQFLLIFYFNFFFPSIP